MYRARSGDGSWHDVDEAVLITLTQTRFGGRRPWFNCPGCARRCRALLGGARFRCRRCTGLRYGSQARIAQLTPRLPSIWNRTNRPSLFRIMATTSAGRMVVLVIDDEPLTRLAAAEWLHDAGFEVLEASSAPEAIRFLESKESIAAIVTDIDLSGPINGFGLAWRAYSRQAGVVIVSGKATPSADLIRPG